MASALERIGTKKLQAARSFIEAAAPVLVTIEFYKQATSPHFYLASSFDELEENLKATPCTKGAVYVALAPADECFKTNLVKLKGTVGECSKELEQLLNESRVLVAVGHQSRPPRYFLWDCPENLFHARLSAEDEFEAVDIMEIGETRKTLILKIDQ